MELPQETANDRRAVPRHIRDGEHDMWRDGLGEVAGEPGNRGRRTRLWMYGALILAAGAALLYFLRA